jgi:hypothetical protein
MPPKEARSSAVTRVALAFAEALARSDWSAAHGMLASSLRANCQPSDLKHEFESMTSYWDGPAKSVELGLADSERAYVAIYSESEFGGINQEAVDVRVVDQGPDLLIDDIVWGRP